MEKLSVDGEIIRRDVEFMSYDYIRQGPRQRQREENLRNWNWEEVIDVDLIPDEDMDGVDGLDMEELFGLGLEDDDIMSNPAGPNINSQRQNTVQVLNKHRVYNIMYENDQMDETDESNFEE
ncbi:hypothetical protein Tco_1549203 [Tanacetum coccineum]